VSSYHHCEQCPARHRGICSALPSDELAAFASVAERQSFKRGERIFAEGAEAGFYAVISSGMAKLTKGQINDRPQIVGLRFASDFLGRVTHPRRDACLIAADQQPRRDVCLIAADQQPHQSNEGPRRSWTKLMLKQRHVCSAEAATGAELCIFPRDVFLRWVAERAELRRELLKAAFSELDECREWTAVLRQRSSYQRVASFLRLMTQRTPRAGIPTSASANTDGTRRARFLLPLARQEIAAFLGITEESVSRQMTLLKKRAVIELVSSREVIVCDMQKLAMAWPAF
jgi:CRP/FNR family transcriptional regulator